MKKISCKITGKVFDDLENKSGSITKHLNSLGIDSPSSYKRRSYLSKNKTHWHLQFFDIIEVEDKKKFKCKYCNWDTYDLENKSGCYTNHLKKEHNKSIEAYLEEFPRESKKFKMFKIKKKREVELSDENNFVECKICNKKLKYITNSHLRKHNITPEEYKIKFGLEDYASKKFIEDSRKVLKKASNNIKNTFVSKPEKDLKKFIEEDLGIEILKNDRKTFNGVEIDIIIPDRKICFEFNGNLYHSENYGGKSKYYHLDKTNICKSKGYKLIHIMEDEWFLSNEIVKEKIRNILKINDKPSVYARKCEIKEISTKQKNEFLNKNHIQGEDKSNVKLGAFYEERLVSVMTFSKNIKANKEKGVFELKRFASDIDYNVVGMFSKFISYFKKNYEFSSMFSFLDIRWNCDEKNNVYNKNGFILTRTTNPDYTYYNSKISRYKRFHKFGFSKNNIKKRFGDIYSDEKTEWGMMQEKGYDRVWDCGKFKFELLD